MKVEGLFSFLQKRSPVTPPRFFARDPVMAHPVVLRSPASRARYKPLFLLVLLLLVGGIQIVPAQANPPITDSGISSTGPGGNGAASPGPPHRWIGNIGGAAVSTGTGNKFTAIPLFGWTAKGGLPVGFAFYHNSFGDWTSGIAPKWTFSYQSWIENVSGNVLMHWDDGTTFTCVLGGTVYTVPPGSYDKLFTPAGTNDRIYATKNQFQYYFTWFAASNRWWLTSIKDRNGYTITINRDPQNLILVTSVVDPTGRTITVNWSGGRISSVVDPMNRTWTVNYGSGTYPSLNSITWPALNGVSRSVNFGYTDVVNQFNIASLQDLQGNTSTFGYTDPSSPNVLTQIKDPCNNTTNITYAQTSNGNGSVTISDPNGRNTTQYYVSGRLDRVTDPAGYTEYYTYDGNYNVVTYKDRKGRNWQFTYDSNGNVLTSKDPDLRTATRTYTAFNDLQTYKDPLNHTWTYGYDAAGNLTSIQDPLT